MSDFWTDLPSQVATGIFSNVAWIILAGIFVWAFFKLKERLIWVTVGALKKVLVLISAQYLILAGLLHWECLESLPALGISFLVSLGIAIFVWKRYRALGIVDAYGSTNGGISYKASLKRPQHSFDFMGVGAHKLTSDPEFKEMVKRCASAGRPVRMLLSHPNNPVLRNVGSRAGIDRNTYGKRVRESLKILGDLHVHEGFSIEVRFYHAESKADFQQFRLAFLDERECVMSYTIWDDKEGRSNPQLILNAGQRKGSSSALYYAFKDYFERLWDDEKTSVVDLAKYR
ncbi:MAG: hypothetical protein GQ535_08760 [Rhodobacteraceae bacterium]|nr:hypothetical protein [Paracoccaceae bacterium]